MPVPAASAAASAPLSAAALAPDARAALLAAALPSVAASTASLTTVMCPFLSPAHLAAVIRAACDAFAASVPAELRFTSGARLPWTALKGCSMPSLPCPCIAAALYVTTCANLSLRLINVYTCFLVVWEQPPTVRGRRRACAPAAAAPWGGTSRGTVSCAPPSLALLFAAVFTPLACAYLTAPLIAADAPIVPTHHATGCPAAAVGCTGYARCPACGVATCAPD
eukprot:gene5068-16893_t